MKEWKVCDFVESCSPSFAAEQRVKRHKREECLPWQCRSGLQPVVLESNQRLLCDSPSRAYSADCKSRGDLSINAEVTNIRFENEVREWVYYRKNHFTTTVVILCNGMPLQDPITSIVADGRRHNVDRVFLKLEVRYACQTTSNHVKPRHSTSKMACARLMRCRVSRMRRFCLRLQSFSK
jgi:hypothetical protein